jgi:protein-tyrosine phosphatase
MSILSNIFGSSRLKDPVDLSAVGTDMHSHFIPGIDDGAKTLEDSLNLIRSMQELGYKKLITTPHIMADYYKNTPEIINKGLEEVRAELRKNNVNIQLEAASEYYLDFDFERKMNEEALLTLGKNYVLFEVSYMHPPENLNNIIFQLILKGYKPVLAHPERYNFWHNDFEKYKEIIDKGALLQMNINSLTGYYSIPTKKIAERMIKEGMVSFLGSDCHHAGHINLLQKVVYEKPLKELIDSGKLLNSTL